MGFAADYVCHLVCDPGLYIALALFDQFSHTGATTQNACKHTYSKNSIHIAQFIVIILISSIEISLEMCEGEWTLDPLPGRVKSPFMTVSGQAERHTPEAGMFDSMLSM